MKFSKAIALLEEEGFEKIENKENLSIKLAEAFASLNKDISIIKQILQENKKVNISWSDLSFSHYKNLMNDFYNLKEGSVGLINKRKQYEQNPNGAIAIFLNKKYGVGNDTKIKTAYKTIKQYKKVYLLINELSSLIRKGNKEKLFNLNIPSIEFKLPLKEELK